MSWTLSDKISLYVSFLNDKINRDVSTNSSLNVEMSGKCECGELNECENEREEKYLYLFNYRITY